MKELKSKKSPTQKRIIVAIALNMLIIALIAIMSVFLYQSMLKAEEENCWNNLEDSARAVEKEINRQIESNVNILKLVSGAMVREQRTGDSKENLEAITSHLNDFQSMTIFERIDVLMENGNILLQTGEVRSSTMDFDAIAQKGVSMSGRRTDVETGKEVIRCSVPVVKDQHTVAILLGVIDCEALPSVLDSSMYDGQAYVCLVDRSTGDFIMDNWHDSLGNLYEMNERKTLSGYEHIDVRDEISKGNTGVVAYESKVNGKASYMFFKPLERLNWQMLVVAQEDVVFYSLNVMKKLLGYMIAFLIILLISYLIWSVMTLRKALESEEKSKMYSYMDNLTGIYNQNKFMKTLEEYANMDFNGVGLLFLDLNGLKYTNDHFGHAEGDRLLKNTADILSKIFGTLVYRIGGDEFVALATNLSEEDFMALEKRVKADMRDGKIEAAMGAHWCMDSKTMRTQLKQADDLMYAVKRSYHESDKDAR